MEYITKKLTEDMENIILLDADEQNRRLARVTEAMRQVGVDTTVISSSSNLYYLTGRVFCGWMVITAGCEPRYYVKRPLHLHGDNITYVRKPEEITLPEGTASGRIGFETGSLSYAAVERLMAALGVQHPANASEVMNRARAVKTDYEIELLRQSGIKQVHVYSMIPKLYRQGMSDIELQIAIEYQSRLEGCLGIFRSSGDSMEIYMGNVLTGRNADRPSPYDFAMGGAGINPSLPVGADGTIIERNHPVMVDMNGDYTGYMTDMTRVYSLGKLDNDVYRAHECSVAICSEFVRNARPGIAAADLYEMAASIARKQGFEHWFMGNTQKAGFVGHGVGIEINEQPVIAPRSKAILQSGNVIALEPKFVTPAGAVGIENTYVIRDNGVECLTQAPEEIIDLE